MNVIHFKLIGRKLGAALLVIFLMETLNSIAQELPPNIKQAIEQAAVTEDGMLNGPEGTRETLMNYMRGNWQAVLGNLDSIAPKDAKKIVLMRAAESLDASEYLAFLQRVRDLRASGKLSPKVFEWAMGPSHYKEGFLEFNYQRPEVRQFIESIRPLTRPEWRHGLDEILSGERKKDIEQRWQAEHSGTVGATLLLPVAATPEPTTPIRTSTPAAATPVSSPIPVASPQPTTPSVQTPAPEVERTSPVWPWVVGIAALAVIALLVWKRRA